jgi:hypothetical protein
VDSAVWTIFKANALFGICSITVSLLIAFGVAMWRKRRYRKMMAAKPLGEPEKGPGMIMFGGVNPQPGHCPLCGRDWPLPGPLLDKPSEQPK